MLMQYVYTLRPLIAILLLGWARCVGIPGHIAEVRVLSAYARLCVG